MTMELQPEENPPEAKPLETLTSALLDVASIARMLEALAQQTDILPASVTTSAGGWGATLAAAAENLARVRALLQAKAARASGDPAYKKPRTPARRPAPLTLPEGVRLGERSKPPGKRAGAAGRRGAQTPAAGADAPQAANGTAPGTTGA